MSLSFSVKYLFTVVAVLIVSFLFIFSDVSAKIVPSKSNCSLNFGLSSCLFTNNSKQSDGIKGLFDFYDAKFNLTVSKVVTSKEETAKLQAQLDQLTLTLLNLKMTVVNSKTLTEAEKTNLLKQIEVINAQILNLKKILGVESDMQSSDYSVPTPPVPEEDKKSAKEAKLEGILVTFNNENDEAKVVLKYKVGNKTKNITLESVAKVSDFYAKMKALKEGLVIELSNSEKIYAEDIKDLYRISARNPVREKEIGKNSPTAKKLYDNFAFQSIINKVIIRPGYYLDGIIASAELRTDQDEWIYVTLSAGSFDTFTVSVQYFATTPFDKKDYDSNGNQIHYPKYVDYANDITKEDIIDLIQDYFDDLNFSKSISNFGKKYTNFVIGNFTFYETDPKYPEIPSDSSLDCYPGSDKSIVNEFNNFLIEDILFQAEPADKITSYIAWTKPAPDMEVFPRGCVAWNAF